MAIHSSRVATTSDTEKAMFDFVDSYDRAYELAAAEHRLSVAQACVLGRIGELRGMRDLAIELGCEPSNVTQVIARLEARGLARRTANPGDGRSRQVERTTSGHSVYADFEQSFEFARAAASNLSVNEQNQLATLLRKALGRNPNA